MTTLHLMTGPMGWHIETDEPNGFTADLWACTCTEPKKTVVCAAHHHADAGGYDCKRSRITGECTRPETRGGYHPEHVEAFLKRLAATYTPTAKVVR